MSVPRVRIDFGGGLQDVALPYNWRDIKFEAIFTDDFPSSTLQSILFEWRGDTARQLNQYFQAGLTGGPGVGEGVPMEVSCGVPAVSFPVIINLADPSCQFELDIVKAPIKRVAAMDWFSDMLESITFRLLAETNISGYNGIVGLPGSFAKYEYKKVPYVVTIPTDIPQAITLIMQEAALIFQFKAAILTTKNDTKKALGDIGLGTTGLYTAVGIVEGISDFVAMILDNAFDALLIISAIGNIEMLMNQFGVIKKYKYAMTARDSINAILDYINSIGVAPPISFKSTILNDVASPYYDLTIMPKKSLKENSSIFLSLLQGGSLTRGTEQGVANTYGYYDFDAKRFITDISKVFNAKGSIIGNVFNLEEVHHFNNVAGFALPNVDKPGYNYNWPAPNGHNFSELSWYYRIAFGTDSMEERTSIVYTGTSCAITLQPKTINHQGNILPSKSTDITFPFALAKRKEYLNVMELVIQDILNVIAPIVDAIILAIDAVIDATNTALSIFGAKPIATPLPLMPFNLLNQLIGCMEVSGDQWQEPKMFIGTDVGGDWKIHPNNGANNNGVFNNPNMAASEPYRGCGYVSAFAIMQQYHGLNLATRGNQWLTYKDKRFAMSSKDFIAIINNNIITTADGKFGKFDKLLWHLNDDEAQGIEYKVNQQYTNNLYETLSVDGN